MIGDRSMTAADRARQRRLVEAMTTPPRAAPDLDQLRELLAANADDGRTGLPWWLDSHEDGPGGYIDIDGIVAGYGRTEHDHDGNPIGTEPAVEELGSLHPQIAGALAVAAVNALPWLLTEVERLRAAIAPVHRLNRPMVEQIRRAAADTSPNWDVTATVYPPSARGLVALIDALKATGECPQGPHRGPEGPNEDLSVCPCIYPDIDPETVSDDTSDGVCACGHVADEHADDGQCQAAEA